MWGTIHACLLQTHQHPSLHYRHEVGFVKKITAVLQEEYPTLPWEEKTSKAVYRGSCYPTANPDAYDPSTYLFLRGAVCDAATRDPTQADMFDVGMWIGRMINCSSKWYACTPTMHNIGTPIDPAYVTDSNYGYCGMQGKPDNFFQSLCQHCTSCNSSKPLDRAAMVDFKYHINVDGYGPTFDAIFVRGGLMLYVHTSTWLNDLDTNTVEAADR